MDQNVLRFASHLLEINHIPVHRISLPLETDTLIDLGLRQAILRNHRDASSSEQFWEECNPNMVYFLTDLFQCRYVVMRLSEKEFLVCGPALFEQMSSERFASIADSLALPPPLHEQLLDYYRQISVSLSQQSFLSIVTALAEHIYGIGAFQIVSQEVSETVTWSGSDGAPFQTAESPLLSMQLIEYRYELENSLMYSVACGDQLHASEIASKLLSTHIGSSILDMVRGAKDDLLGLNSLLRIAAEQAKVHPMHINALHTRCLQLCEELVSIDQAPALAQHLVREYCQMVRQFTLKYNSPLVKRVISLIDADLSGNLTLKNIAAQVNVNACYLSSLFSREVGLPLTDYVNRKRIELAKYLLRTTTLQIKHIVEQVGISDVYYFSRLFKQITGTTPSNYRTSQHINSGPGFA